MGNDILHPDDEHERRRSRITVKAGVPEALWRVSEAGRAARKKRAAKHHSRKKVAFFNYSYYNVAFQFFVERVLDAEFIELPESTRRTLEIGSRESSDFVCAPFKHILGNYIEALELGADVLVQFAGPCRLGFYGELQEAILHDMGYDFDMINFAFLTGKPAQDYVTYCMQKVNPDLNVAVALKNLMATAAMVEHLDAYNDYFLAHAGFEVEHGSFERARSAYYESLKACEGVGDVERAHHEGMAALQALATDEPVSPVRVGLIGEFYTAIDPASNLYVAKKLTEMRVGLAQGVTLTNRYLRYNEENLRQSVSEYLAYDMGPTSTLTVAAAKRYAEEGFDGLVHMKSSGCTPEIDVMPVLQRISRDYHIPILYLSYDSQTSDAGLDTRLEAFYDMISMKKVRS